MYDNKKGSRPVVDGSRLGLCNMSVRVFTGIINVAERINSLPEHRYLVDRLHRVDFKLGNDKLNPKGLSEISDISDQTFPSLLSGTQKLMRKLRCVQ